MGYVHYNYRRAKHFKLDEELEVNDEFTGTAKRQLSGWKRWEYGCKIGNVYAVHGRSFERFLRSSVGKRVDQVYSDFISRMHGPMKNHPDIRDDFYRKVKTVVEIDGTLIDKCTKYNRCGPNKISYGDFYRDPKTGILKVYEEGENWRSYNRHYRKNQPIMIEGIEYRKIRKQYRKRIVSGVYQDEYVDTWFRMIRHTYISKEAVYVRDFNTKWNRYGKQVFSHYKEVENEHFVKQTVSKEDIKKLKLESYEYDLHPDCN